MARWMRGDAADTAGAEASLLQAIEISRAQEARTWELRVATSLVRFWRQQRRIDEARSLLSRVYDEFIEGYDMVDLKKAKALLAEL